MTQTSRGRRRTFTRRNVQDTLWFLTGQAIILHQAFFVPPPDFNLWLVVTGAVIAGVPGADQLLSRFGGGSPISTQSPVSQQQSRSSSSGPSEVETG